MVSATHLNARLRVIDAQDDVMHSFNRVRPNIDADSLEAMMNLVTMIQGRQMRGVTMTVTTQLGESPSSN